NLVQRGTASLERLFQVFHEQPEIKDAETPSQITEVRGEIEFRNLTFSYPADGARPALRDINLRVPAGQTLAVVGRTGSGKSTLVGLIPRLHDAPAGTVFVDGVEIRAVPLATLRRSIGFVPQETFLFSETIRENICFGLESNNGNAVEAAEIA